MGATTPVARGLEGRFVLSAVVVVGALVLLVLADLPSTRVTMALVILSQGLLCAGYIVERRKDRQAEPPRRTLERGGP